MSDSDDLKPSAPADPPSGPPPGPPGDLPSGGAPPPGAPPPDDPPDDDEGPDSDDLRDLLRRTAAAPVPPPKQDLLRGVQSRLRVRSEGKFYSDGWATREDNPRGTYLITAAVMLLLLLVVYWALVPGAIGAVP